MNKKRMEFLRETINTMLVSERPNKIELLKMSQELDKLILQSIKKSNYVKIVLGNELMKKFEVIVDKLQLFEKMYQFIRIVDPVGKKVLELNEFELCEMDVICYEFWKKQLFCEDCASIRAYNEDDTIFKMERHGNRIYMVVAVPISIQGKKLVVELLRNASSSFYAAYGKIANEIHTFSAIEYMSLAAVKDELTNLYNKKYINEKLPVDLLNSSLRNEPLSIIFAEMDFLRTVSDTYGHPAGDQALQGCAEELKRHIRNGKDWAARYGDEEFIICLSNTDIDDARSVAEKIGKSIMQKEFIVGNERIHLTCSFGVHTVSDENECMKIDDIIKLVDKKLY